MIRILQTGDEPLIGDMVEAWAEKWGMATAAAVFEKWSGLPCGCGWRKRVLNTAHAKLKSLLRK